MSSAQKEGNATNLKLETKNLTAEWTLKLCIILHALLNLSVSNTVSSVKCELKKTDVSVFLGT